MGQNILLSQNHLQHSKLQQVITSLLSFIDVDSVYISPGNRQPESKTIVSLFIKKGSTQSSEDLYNVAEKLFGSYPQFAYRVFDADWAEYSLRKGNPFFISHCSVQELAYNVPESGAIFNATITALNHLLKKAEKRYRKDKQEINALNMELSMYIRNGNHLQAAYILQQTIRRLYYTASWFLAGESIPAQSLAEQQNYISPFSTSLGDLFNSEDIADAVLLEQLDSACEAVRNNKPITINLETIPAAVLKAEGLQKEVQRLFEESIQFCKQKFAQSLNDNPEEPIAEREETYSDKRITNNTFDELEELATRHFKRLQPDPKKEGVYTATIKFIGYADLMCFVTDLIKLSITSYIDNEDNGYGEDSGSIVNSKVNIANILEIVIQLLPMHEAEYLDILTELFFEHRRNQKKQKAI